MKLNKIIAVASGLLIIATSVGMSGTAEAKWRRMTADAVCHGNPGAGYDIGSGSNSIGIEALGSSAFATCWLPSDSYFNHIDINKVNVHMDRNTADYAYWHTGARVCVKDYSSDSYSCGQRISPPNTLGEHTLTFTGVYLNSLTAYSAWGPYVGVTLYGADKVRFLYVTE
ncbi:MAG: hypothetical protein JXR76_28800 [Deltaproteobacteria bacterium]|nr:hypothetical protein [Deltaproteobacteria bacterium]